MKNGRQDRIAETLTDVPFSTFIFFKANELSINDI